VGSGGYGQLMGDTKGGGCNPSYSQGENYISEGAEMLQNRARKRLVVVLRGLKQL
jgi:hypothetical protein